VTVGYWLFALLAVSLRGRLRDANPVGVAGLALRLGYRSLVATFLATGLVIAHGLPALAALGEVQRGGGPGWLLLACCWAGGLFGATFLLRLLGVWCHAARLRAFLAQATAAEEGPSDHEGHHRECGVVTS
jgi:hypothetical protein